MGDLDPRAFPLRGRRVVLGVGGGIAAYKAAELARLLMGAGAEVRAVMTPAAREFLTPLTLQTLTGHPVGTDLFDLGQESEIGHIRLAEQADLVIVAPATADLLARMASGMANDLLTTLLLVTRAPVLLAPAMNVHMWSHELVQENVRRLVGLGRIHLVGPDDGWLACRMTGPGRLAEPADILEAAGRLLVPHDLAGRSVLVTAGPTHEALDPARYLANRSSGKMGYALARAAAARGARVTLVTGPTALAAPLGVAVVRVTTALELEAAVSSRAAEQDLVVMAAAVADFRAARAATKKLKKATLGATPTITLAENPDVLAGLGRARAERGARLPVLVGFAAETGRVTDEARRKLVAKGCDLIVGNDVSRRDAGFATDTNRVTIVGPGKKLARVPLATKDEVAHRILDAAAALVSAARK
ncbi:MAG: bifunctional phosphopantothenoylcysteine decarboxylase/phosphopantothenate--cysteine ligase CoaBC [Myxococcales bacterium]|nr:bifunctional phosphopantothenoylcysteine decarboxylase/phosphopantothenate--cysteine ligase CoaBC [Myxococcales bacterium]